MLVYAAAGVFMQVGVPGCDEWNVHSVGDEGTENPHVARAGNVNQIGREIAQDFLQERQVAAEKRIAVEILIERKG